MKFIRPEWEVLNEQALSTALREIETAARTCYKSEDKMTDSSHYELVSMLMKKGHEAMLEFGPSPVVKFICDRGVSHELVRHRLCDFAQESTRYCNYAKDKFDNQVTFIIPPWITDEQLELARFMNERNFTKVDEGVRNWYIAVHQCEQSYNQLIKQGWQPQQARAVLPNSLKTEIVVKANIREWRHIFKQRTSRAAHPQMRELMNPLLHEFQRVMPILFDDITEADL